MNDRIKLAEAVFHGRIAINGKLREYYDPFTDANDCEALKIWLQSYGWHIEIKWQAHTNLCPAPAVYVEIWHEASEIHHRYDTDRGESFAVATVALKVINTPNEEG